MKNFFSQAHAVNWEDVEHSTHTTVEKDHGRVETREIKVVNDIEWLPQKDSWKKMNDTIIENFENNNNHEKTSRGCSVAALIRFMQHMKIPDLFAGLPDLRQQSKTTYTLTLLSLWALRCLFRQGSKMPFKRHLRVSVMALKSFIVTSQKLAGDLHPLQKDSRRKNPWFNK